MPTLHALFVGIDQYPVRGHALKGCVADLNAFREYLKTWCESEGYVFNPGQLLNQDATRKAVIDAFKHFDNAASGDQCLFFFAGHGARTRAPEAFLDLESDRKIESIVCWDSRMPDGFDLMDKEISYLVWKALGDKDIPMITITDCCHSGSLRDLGEMEPDGIREIRDATGRAMPLEDYAGYEFYKKDESGQWSPPVGRRIHLGASHAAETAKEVTFNGQPRGIFTCCLVHALRSGGPNQSYAELMNRVQMRVRANVAGQSPQLETTFAADKKLRFLTTRSDSGAHPFLVTYHQGWILNAGAIHGLLPGNGEQSTLLELESDQTPLRLSEVGPGTSRVEGMGDRPKTQVYRARLLRRGIPKLNLETAIHSDPAAVAAVKRQLEQQPGYSFQFGTGHEPADFVLHAADHALWLTLPQETEPLFQRIKGYDAEAVQTFLERLEVIANWQRVLDMTNPASSIPKSDLEVTLYRVTEAGNVENHAPMEENDWYGLPQFPYLKKASEWCKPGFQMRIKNKSQQRLWVSLLYLGYDYSITNQLLPKEPLGPGEEVWAREVYGGQSFRTISLQVEDVIFRKGIDKVREYFKWFVYTDETETDAFYQEGLEPDTGAVRSTRIISSRNDSEPKGPDWCTLQTMIRIVRPPEV